MSKNRAKELGHDIFSLNKGSTRGPIMAPLDQMNQVELAETDLGDSPAYWEKIELDQIIRCKMRLF